MLKYGYEGFDEHKLEHQKLIEGARAMQEKFRQEGKLMSIDDIKSVEHWLTGHILSADMELGSFLSKVM